MARKPLPLRTTHGRASGEPSWPDAVRKAVDAERRQILHLPKPSRRAEHHTAWNLVRTPVCTTTGELHAERCCLARTLSHHGEEVSRRRRHRWIESKGKTRVSGSRDFSAASAPESDSRAVVVVARQTLLARATGNAALQSNAVSDLPLFDAGADLNDLASGCAGTPVSE